VNYHAEGTISHEYEFPCGKLWLSNFPQPGAHRGALRSCYYAAHPSPTTAVSGEYFLKPLGNFHGASSSADHLGPWGQTQPSSQPVSHSQAPDDSTDALESHSVCLETVKDLECDLRKVDSDLQKVKAERDKLREENQTLRQQLSQAQHAQSVGHTWEDIQRAVHGAQEALNTCHQQLISCMTNAANTGVPSATLPGSTAGPDSLWANQDERLEVLNPQMFSFEV
jgi:hypothetical protein